MNNYHIIVGEGKRCMCGEYGGNSITYRDVLLALSLLEHHQDNDTRKSISILNMVIHPLLEVRQIPVSSGFTPESFHKMMDDAKKVQDFVMESARKILKESFASYSK